MEPKFQISLGIFSRFRIDISTSVVCFGKTMLLIIFVVYKLDMYTCTR